MNGNRTRSIVAALAALATLVAAPTLAQTTEDRPPVIDVHMHAPASPGEIENFNESLDAWLANLERLNVRKSVLMGLPDILDAWAAKAGDRAIPSVIFPCQDGASINWGRPCNEYENDWPVMEKLRADIESGRFQGLGETGTQYLGMGPANPLFEPYFALAEEYDIPIYIHMGPGPRFSAYEENPFAVRSPNYRASAGNPLLLEELLVKYPGARVVVLHAGWPLADEMVFLMYQHPQVWAELGLLQYEDWFPREEYYAFLKRLVRAGYTDRILFGSDTLIEEGIDAIREADFLTEEQKDAILCKNAARLLRLDAAICE